MGSSGLENEPDVNELEGAFRAALDAEVIARLGDLWAVGGMEGGGYPVVEVYFISTSRGDVAGIVSNVLGNLDPGITC